MTTPIPTHAPTHPWSTGPKTPQGKLASARNSTKHGLSGKDVVLATEDRDAFEALRDGILERLDPADALERVLAERVAACAWRLQRALRVETELLDRFACVPFAPPMSRSTTMDLFVRDAAHAEMLPTIHRYAAAAERGMYRAMVELERLQARRRGETVSAPSVIDVRVADEQDG